MQVNECIKVIECFKQLEQSLYQLAPVLYHDTKLPMWLSDNKGGKATRQQIYHTLNQLEYTDEQDSLRLFNYQALSVQVMKLCNSLVLSIP